MPDVLTAVTTAISATKQLLELASIAKDASAKLAIADLQIKLAEVKTELASIVEENLRLKEELKSVSSAGQNVVFKDGLYYKSDNDGPFCTTCYDLNRKLVRVLALPRIGSLSGWRCGACKSHFPET